MTHDSGAFENKDRARDATAISNTSVTMPASLNFLLFLFLSSTLADDSVSEDVSPRQLERLLELLTPHECEELISAISQPEESIFTQLERLSAERNQLLPSRQRRDTDQQTPCLSALKDWLQIHGQQIYYDRLSRALQQIGRTDIAIEVSKNINQDKTLAIQKYVEGYHKLVSQMATNQEKHQPDQNHKEILQLSAKQARGLTWKDVDLIVKRRPVSPYQPRLLERVWPILIGVLLGLLSATLMFMAVWLISIHASQRISRQETQNQGQTSSPSLSPPQR